MTGKIWIEIVNAHGASVSIIQTYASQPGRELLSWEAKDASGGPLAPGLYMFQLVSGEKSYSGKFILQ